VDQATPTLCHMSLVALQNSGVMKYLVSQNCDGLHRRSGIRADMISELHGNGYIELCEKCKHEYLRTFKVNKYKGKEIRISNLHSTGRRCTQAGCSGGLMDSIIHFGENLPSEPLSLAEKHSKNSDLAVVLGTSLRVSPANKLPKYAKKAGAKLVIINLQPTPLDDKCDLRIYAKTDDVMKIVMKQLGIEIPFFQPTIGVSLAHRILPKSSPGDIKVRLGLDGLCGTDASGYVKQVTLKTDSLEKVVKKAPFEFDISTDHSFDVHLKVDFYDSRFASVDDILYRISIDGPNSVEVQLPLVQIQ